MTVTANLISEVFRAKGVPNLSFWTQILHLVVLIPVIYICIQYDFSTFVYARSIVRMEMLMVAMIFLALFIHMSALRVITNIGCLLYTSGRKLMQLILGKTSYLAIQNYLECEAHHELFLRGIKNINKK